MEDQMGESFLNPDRKCVSCGGDVTNRMTLRCQPCYFKQVRETHAGNRGVRAEGIIEKRKAGASVISIAKEMGISRIRIYQILDAYKRDNPAAFEQVAKDA
jgi:hypothetical protein